MTGDTAMEVSVAAVTVSVVDPEMPPDVAEIADVCPAVPAVANPAAVIVAPLEFAEAQVTDDVKSCVLLSE